MFYTDQEYNKAIRPYISGTSQECSYCKKINVFIINKNYIKILENVRGAFNV